MSFFQFNFILIGGKLLYNFVLVSAVQPWESVKIIHISLPSGDSLTSLHSTTLGHHRAQDGLPVLFSSFLLTILQMTRFLFIENEKFKSSLRTIGVGNFLLLFRNEIFKLYLNIIDRIRF